jgi:PAS domain S-box-containing protein
VAANTAVALQSVTAALLDAGPDAWLVSDADGTIVLANAQAKALFGYPDGELLGKILESVLTGPPTHPLKGPVEVARSQVSTPLGTMTVAVVRGNSARLEAALRSAEAQLRDRFERASEGIVIADLDGRFLDANPAYCAMLGFTREELLAKRVIELVPEEDVPYFAAYRARLLAPGTVEVGEWRLRRKDGALLTVESSARILPDGRWQAFVRDISGRKADEAERRRLLEAQREQTTFLNALVENIPAMIFMKDADTLRFERVNSAAEELLGWPREAMIGKDDYDFFSKEQAEFFQAKDRETLRSGRLHVIEEEPIQTREGERWLHTMKIPLFGDDGSPRHLLGISVDITARKAAESARDATMRWLRAVLDQSPIGILLSGGEVGAPVTLNDAARRLLGVEGKVLLPDEGFVCTADGAPLPRDETPLRQALRGNVVESGDSFVRRQDGEVVPVIGGCSPVRDGNGAVIGAVAVAYDATSIKELERLRVEWNSIVAHDLRQPLATILLQVRLLAEQNKDLAELHGGVERIQRSVLRLDRMVGDLMDLSRLEAKRLSLTRKSVDLPALARVCLDDAPRVDGRALELELRGEIPFIEADPDRIYQILQNLLSNAIKYGASGTPVVVTIGSEDSQVSVAVTNEGRGIAPEELPRLFQRFRRTEDAKLAGLEGVGLGLFITRSLVEAHGGWLDVRSAVGGTTTFRFTLPSSSRSRPSVSRAR